jgi:hypothetical protein
MNMFPQTTEINVLVRLMLSARWARSSVSTFGQTIAGEHVAYSVKPCSALDLEFGSSVNVKISEVGDTVIVTTPSEGKHDVKVLKVTCGHAFEYLVMPASGCHDVDGDEVWMEYFTKNTTENLSIDNLTYQRAILLDDLMY